MLFVFNPKAGKGRVKAHLMDILNVFNKSDYEVVIYATQKSREAYEKAKAYANQVDLIVCSGGDGTLDEVVTGITEVGSTVAVGYIPAGSTNDFANSLFMPKNMVEAAQGILEEKPYYCDIGRFNKRTFAYIAAFGLFTDVSYQTSQDMKNMFGHAAYLLEGMKRMGTWKSKWLRVESEEYTDEGNLYSA